MTVLVLGFILWAKLLSNLFFFPSLPYRAIAMSSSSAMVRILIKGGKVVNDDCTQEADVYIENGIIQQVGKEMMIPGGAKVIDASGKLVLPGGIDTSVHLEESFMNATTADDYYSGTKVTSRCMEVARQNKGKKAFR